MTTGDFFYSGSIDASTIEPFLARMDYKGNTIWNKHYQDIHYAYLLSYSMAHESLFLSSVDSNNQYFCLTRVNSTDGNILLSYKIGNSNFASYGGCSLSNDDSSLY